MSLRVQKPGRARTRAIAHPDRPPIWADGRQQPPFDMQAFLRASLTNARAASQRGLEAGAERAAAARSTMPRLAAGTQELCASAARSLRAEEPELDADTRMMRAVLARAFPRPAEPAPASTPSRNVSDDDATLAAIRAVLREDEAVRRPAAQSDRAAPQARSGALARLIATATVIALLPFGAVAALHAHLTGEDLRLSG